MEEICIESQGLEQAIGLGKKEKEGEEHKQVTTTIRKTFRDRNQISSSRLSVSIGRNGRENVEQP